MNRFLIAVGSLVVAGALFAILPGCGKKPVAPGEEANKARKVEPWENIAARLRQDTDVNACRTALAQLNNELSERPDLPQPSRLSPESEKSLRALVPLMPDELEEIAGSAYSSLDPAYLADCFLLRDTARSIDPTGLPPQELSRLAFAWVCRQVILQPWIVDARLGYLPAVPPTWVLARGSGSGLERAYVFLALLQQLGLDGCLVGDAGRTTGIFSGSKLVLENGPFWAAGVRIGSEIVLFNPWSGEPYLAPDGKAIATLEQVKVDPAKWKVPADAKFSIALAPQLSSLAPRMAMLESKIAADTGVKLHCDAASLLAKFPAGTKVWNPPGDRFTYTRVQFMFLPLEEGGHDRGELEDRPHTYYKKATIPKNLVELPQDLNPGVADRLRMGIFSVYGSSFLMPPTPRERIQRGQLQDAARDLTRKRDAFGLGLERLRSLDPAESAVWRMHANAAMDDVNAARFPNPGQTTPQPDNDPNVQQARAKFESFWRDTESVSRVIIDRATAALGRADSAYLLALAKHEEAERNQSRGGSALDSWREAANAWSAFLEQDGDKGTPERTAHATALAARAKSFTETK